MRIDDISFQHERSGARILADISFEAERGSMTVILGPNGSGKTTLFNCISGIWKPQKGRITFDGADLTGLSPRKRARVIGSVPQAHEPPFPYTVIDAGWTGRASHLSMISAPSKEDYERADEAIATVGISHLRARPYTKISGGERQLVLIARALVQETPVLLLDEPSSHLDYKNQIMVLDIVRGLARKRGLTVLMTLHDPNLAMTYGDSTVLMQDGRVAASGEPAKVLTKANLFHTYGIDVSIIKWNGKRIIHPEGKACSKRKG